MKRARTTINNQHSPQHHLTFYHGRSYFRCLIRPKYPDCSTPALAAQDVIEQRIVGHLSMIEIAFNMPYGDHEFTSYTTSTSHIDQLLQHRSRRSKRASRVFPKSKLILVSSSPHNPTQELVRLRDALDRFSSDTGLIPALLPPPKSPLAVLRTACLIVSICSSLDGLIGLARPDVRPGDCSILAAVTLTPGGGVLTPPERGDRNGDAARSCLKLEGRLAKWRLSLLPASLRADVGGCWCSL